MNSPQLDVDHLSPTCAIAAPARCAILPMLLAAIFCMPAARASGENLFVSVGSPSVPGSGKIVEISAGGTQSTYASGLSGPYGIGFDPSGNLFEADLGSGAINKILPGGQVTTFAAPVNHANIPIALAVDSSGNVYDGDDSGNIYKFTPDGTRSTYEDPFWQYSPFGMVLDSAGNLYVTNYSGNDGSVWKVPPGGGSFTTVAAFGAGGSGLAVDAAGNFYAASFGGGQINEYFTGGGYTPYATGLSNPEGIAFDSQGNLFEVDNGTGSIYEITRAGRTLVASGLGAGLAGPHFIAIQTPEPPGIVLLTLGFLTAAIAAARRRTRALVHAPR